MSVSYPFFLYKYPQLTNYFGIFARLGIQDDGIVENIAESTYSTGFHLNKQQ
ncbi:MAG: hypothetical protein ACE5EA_08085 [Nitrospirota bacterium]